MKTTVFFILALAGIIIFMNATPIAAQQGSTTTRKAPQSLRVKPGVMHPVWETQSKDQLVKFYESCIQKKVSKCNAKAVFKTSRSVNLQRKADLSIRQAAFFTSNKDMLINEMLEQGIGQKQYQVEYYLIHRFYEINR